MIHVRIVAGRVGVGRGRKDGDPASRVRLLERPHRGQREQHIAKVICASDEDVLRLRNHPL
ncbi:MAG: hypothetical protein ACHQ9S_06295 [Candidatus Binatia bacterium]